MIQNIRLTTVRYCSILRLTAGWISANWSRTWLPYSRRGLNCGRSAYVMRRRFWAASVSAEGRCAAIPICPDFAPVSIKMAKEQNLSLNPAKISGTCGRLMCCLKNEQETYEYLNRKLPNNGDVVITPDGMKGEVQSTNVLRQDREGRSRYQR